MAAEAGVVVESGLVGTSVIVHQGLAEMKAVAQGSSRYAAKVGVDAFQGCARAAGLIQVGLKLAFQGIVEVARFSVGTAALDGILAFFQHVRDAEARPRAQTEIGGIEITEGVKADERRIHPTIDGDIRGAARAGGNQQLILGGGGRGSGNLCRGAGCESQADCGQEQNQASFHTSSIAMQLSVRVHRTQPDWPQISHGDPHPMLPKRAHWSRGRVPSGEPNNENAGTTASLFAC